MFGNAWQDDTSSRPVYPQCSGLALFSCRGFRGKASSHICRSCRVPEPSRLISPVNFIARLTNNNAKIVQDWAVVRISEFCGSLARSPSLCSGFAREHRVRQRKKFWEGFRMVYQHPQNGQSRCHSIGTRGETLMSRISELILEIQPSPLCFKTIPPLRVFLPKSD